MSGHRVAVVVFPGTNSEDETLRAVHAVGLDGELVHWSRPEELRRFDAFILPGGFAYEDRIRAGAVAAHDAVMDPVIDAAQSGKYVLGICNGAQVLAEAGLVPGTAPVRRPTAAFAPNASGRFQSVHVHVKLAVAPERVPILGGIESGAVISGWASHGDGRLAAPADELVRIERDGHLAFVYCDRDGNEVPAPNGSALNCAALVNRQGNVLA
ncbi:MAG TPA: phosphoribosylformylglycinamidine synthase subunit PurQ, partial [Xanthomonadales bacterium]|nr:phosphoribosylformylglycinamidine synthase subunit PurQ [Xanthomonadales bacterium]